MNNKSLSIVVPVFNEEKSLGVLIPQWLEYCEKMGCKLVIVNDGSTDNSKNILSSFHSDFLKVINHKINMGYGAALKTGIRSAETEIAVTIDADGQHKLADIENLLNVFVACDADMVIGSRRNIKIRNIYREIGKRIIRKLISFLFSTIIYDINSGMKMFKTDFAKKYISICPDSMAFSDIFVLIFINKGHLVIEHPIELNERIAGKSTITTRTAFETIWEIFSITMLFSPLKIFMPFSILFISAGIIWEIPIIFTGGGLSVGANLLILVGIFLLFIALIAEQISTLIKSKIE